MESCLDGAAKDGDLLLVSPDGESTPAHSFILKHASPVVSAMISTQIGRIVPQNDDADSGAGKRKEIHMQEPARVVRMFLTFLYTGCLPSPAIDTSEEIRLKEGLRVIVAAAFMSNSKESTLLPTGIGGEVQSFDKIGDALIKFDGVQPRQWVTRKNFHRLKTATSEDTVRLQHDWAEALMLAHRWQVSGLAEVLIERLESELCAETFEAVLEVAILHNASQLRAACLSFAQVSADVRAAYESSSYTPSVLAVLHDVLGGGPHGSSRKRPREPL